MSSARRPDHIGSVALGVPPAQRTDPVLDPLPAEFLSQPPAPEMRPTHLVPCGQCSALNGRSALVCWACEADLLAFSPFASAAPARAPEPAPVAVPVVYEQTVVEYAGAADGHRGLHLVSRVGTPASIQPAPARPAPEFSGELPVLTMLLEEPVLAHEPVPAEPRARRPYPGPMIALAIAVVLLLLIAASLRWRGVPAAPPPPIAGNAVPVGAAAERPFASPAQGSAPDDTRLSFPPREVAPADAAADAVADAVVDRPVRVSARAKPAAPARSVSKARETRPTVAQAVDVLLPPAPPVRQRNGAPAPCTSNMAALGFCTLEPASAKE